MNRRLFLQSASGLFVSATTLGLANAAHAASAPASQAEILYAAAAAEAPVKLPQKANLKTSFGLLTDIHYSTAPVRTIPAEDSVRVYAHSLPKMRQAIDVFNSRNLDFAVELGDFKDCLDEGNRAETIGFLQTVESEYQRFNGPRYHVCGNHDFDRISLGDYLANTENAGDAKGKTYYAFRQGGIKFIVLDACHNNAAGEHYSLGHLDWTVAIVPDEELAWLEKELADGTEPVVVFTHQLLNTWDEKPQNIPHPFFIHNANRVVEILEKSRRVLAVFSGHFHKGAYSEKNGIHYVVLQGLVERPMPHNVAAMVHIAKDDTIYVEGLWNERSHTCA